MTLILGMRRWVRAFQNAALERCAGSGAEVGERAHANGAE